MSQNKRKTGPFYGIRDCCRDCKKVFIMESEDEDNEYFCHIDGSTRPDCGSAAMGEQFPFALTDDDELENVRKEMEWIQWSMERSVDVCGHCEEFEEKDTDG